MKLKRGPVIKTGKFLIPFLFSLVTWAQDVQVSATLDMDRVPLGETFVVIVTVQSTGTVQVDEPGLPQVSGMQLIQRTENTSVQQSLSSTPQGMDWKTIRRQQFNYHFQATQLGQLSVDAIEVVVNGKLYQTKPLLVEVLPENQRPQRPQADDDLEEKLLQEQDDIFDQLLRRHMMPQGRPQFPGPTGPGTQNQKEPEFRSMPTNANEAFFIQLEVDKKSVYEGEQVKATWYLVTRGQMESLDRAKFPSLKGFWKEIIEENPQIQFYEEVINGTVYRKALMATHALFPIKSGKAIIDEFTVKSRVRMPMSGFGFGFGRAYEFTKSSKRLEIDVKPLPLDGRPKEFTGAVGQFEVTSQVEGTGPFFVNQPVTIKIRFEGVGNAKTLDLPLIEWPEGVELYDTKNESRFFKDGRSYKEFEVLLIPRKEGPLNIPQINFAFFDPETEKYVTKSTAPISLDLLPDIGNKNEASGSFLGKKTETKPVILSLPVLQTKLSQTAAQSSTSIWPILFLLSTVGLFGYGYQQLKPQDKSVSLRKKLDGKFQKIFELAKKNDFRQTGAEIVNTSNFVLAEVTSFKGEKLEIQKMIDQLPPQIRESSADPLLKMYEKAQVFGFAPDEILNSMKSQENLQQFCGEAQKILNLVCASWRPKV